MCPAKWKGGSEEKRKKESEKFFANTKEKFGEKGGRHLGNLKQETWELPGWVKTAFVFVDLGGKTYTEAAREFGKSPSTLKNYVASPAAKKWRAALKEVGNDPKVLAKGVLQAAVADAAAYLLWAMEAAKLAGDFKEVRMISGEILDRLQVLHKTKEIAPPAPPTIHLHVGGEVATAIVEVDSKVIEGEVDAVIDPD